MPQDLTPSREVLQPVDAPVVPQSAGLTALPGPITAIVTPETDSRGPGDGPRGAGPGRRGDGFGDGQYGSGLNRGGGPGPGGVGDGEGIDPPVVIKQVKPSYTAAALQARAQGVVLLDAMVLPDGSVGEVRVVRSLDRQTGLDEEAIKAVKQWRFRAGTRAGRPVPMLVSIELTFTLR
jgi:protein TonB